MDSGVRRAACSGSRGLLPWTTGQPLLATGEALLRYHQGAAPGWCTPHSTPPSPGKALLWKILAVERLHQHLLVGRPIGDPAATIPDQPSLVLICTALLWRCCGQRARHEAFFTCMAIRVGSTSSCAICDAMHGRESSDLRSALFLALLSVVFLFWHAVDVYSFRNSYSAIGLGPSSHKVRVGSASGETPTHSHPGHQSN